MKTFAQFIKEAVETLASTEAKNRGLIGDGHGDWYDRQGNLVAKTVGGKLKYFNQSDPSKQQAAPKEQPQSNQSQTSTGVQNDQQMAGQEQQEVNGVVIVIGRFNPPSKNHEALLRAGMREAKRRGFEYRVYPSRVEDGATNPLNPSLKIAYMQSMFPEYADYIIDSDNARTIFDILGSVYDDGYTDVVVITGQDRLGEFQNLIHKGDGQQYQFNNTEVISSGIKDPDSDVETPGSSAMMRTAAAMGDFERFSTGLPLNMDTREKEEMFNTISRSMKVTEDTEVWKIVPELDYEGLRWNYKNNGLFEVGTFVESLSNGLVGKIIRRGANYLICVTEDGVMFKSWLKDVVEVYEIGTCEYRKHAQEMTPGQPVISYTDVLVKRTIPKKINKIRKKASN